MKTPTKYFLLAVLFWFVVDFTTTYAIKSPSTYYATYMPALLIFYIGSPLVFTALIYKFKLSNKALLIATLINIIIVEILFTGNTLFFTFPLALIIIPVSISIYALLTFLPKWIVEKNIKNNKWKIITMLTIYILVSLATAFGNPTPTP